MTSKKYMNFEGAMATMRNGKSVTRSAWRSHSDSVSWTMNIKFGRLQINGINSNYVRVMNELNSECIFAEDWFEVQ